MDCPGAHAIAFQNFETTVPVQGIVRLLEVEEDLIEDRLPHFCHMLETLGFEGGITRPPSSPKTMDGVMKADSPCETPVEDSCYRLPQYLHKAYHLETPTAL